MKRLTLTDLVPIFQEEKPGNGRIVPTKFAVRAGAELLVSEPATMTVVMGGCVCDKPAVYFKDRDLTYYLLVEEIGQPELSETAAVQQS